MMIGSRSLKVPVNKMVRTDSLDPAGRLHAYTQITSDRNLGMSASLNAVRWFPYISFTFVYLTELKLIY